MSTSIDNLIFVAFNHHVLGMNRIDGTVVWRNSKLPRGYMSLMLDGDRLIVSSNGYMYCLDPATGKELWSNPLRGFGTGPTAMVSVRGQSSQNSTTQAAASIDTARTAAAAH